MKTKIPIKKYELSDQMRATLSWLLEEETKTNRDGGISVARQVAEEYKKLEEHHGEETKFLIKTIEELEKIVESQGIGPCAASV